jgi:hypothetical protein
MRHSKSSCCAVSSRRSRNRRPEVDFAGAVGRFAPAGEGLAVRREGDGVDPARVPFEDGTRLASASGDRTVRIWDTLSAHDRAQVRLR